MIKLPSQSPRNSRQAEGMVTTDCIYQMHSTSTLTEMTEANPITNLAQQTKGEVDDGLLRTPKVESSVPDILGTEVPKQNLTTYPTARYAENRKIHQPPLDDYSSCLEKIGEQLPHRLQEFFELVKDSELDDMLADISDMQLERPVPTPTPIPESWLGSSTKPNPNTVHPYNSSPPSVNPYAQPDGNFYYNSSNPCCQQTSPSLTNYSPHGSAYNLQNRGDVTHMYPQITDVLARQSHTYQHQNVCTSYTVNNNYQNFTCNQMRPCNQHPARLGPNSDARRNPEHSVQRKLSKTLRHLPIPDAPNPSWMYNHHFPRGYNHLYQGNNQVVSPRDNRRFSPANFYY